jgi:uncharacterized protein (TIGR02452 family)
MFDDCVTWRREFDRLSETVSQGNESLMPKIRQMRADIFQQTLDVVNKGRYTVKEDRYLSGKGKEVILPDDTAMREGTKLYHSEITLDEKLLPPKGHTEVRVMNLDCLFAAKMLLDNGYNPAVLNMASRQTPGGGVYGGAGAQEENLFRRSNLFRSMYKYAEFAGQYGLEESRQPEHYPLDRDFGGVYTPDAVVFRGTEQDGYPLLDAYYRMSFIAVPAMSHPNLERIETSDGFAWRIVPELVDGTKNKMRTIFRIGLLHGHDALVLGAFGCGAFRNPANHIAQLFHEVMEEEEFKNRYKLICFAIIEDHNAHKEPNLDGNYRPFKDEFYVKRWTKERKRK